MTDTAEQLCDALLVYGRHRDTCEFGPALPCTCGWLDAVRTLGARHAEQRHTADRTPAAIEAPFRKLVEGYRANHDRSLNGRCNCAALCRPARALLATEKEDTE